MKEYLFDKIEILDSGVEFIPCDENLNISVAELISLRGGIKDVYSKKWSPVSLKGFLKMLKKTKLNDDNDYTIIDQQADDGSHDVDFTFLLNAFLADMDYAKPIDYRKWLDFEKQANQIRTNERTKNMYNLDRDI